MARESDLYTPKAKVTEKYSKLVGSKERNRWWRVVWVYLGKGSAKGHPFFRERVPA